MITFGRQLGLEAKIWILSGVVAVLTVVAYVALVAPLITTACSITFSN